MTCDLLRKGDKSGVGTRPTSLRLKVSLQLTPVQVSIKGGARSAAAHTSTPTAHTLMTRAVLSPYSASADEVKGTESGCDVSV